MLKRLRIQNFKGWADTGIIELAPISLFFGANSSGKSSIIEKVLYNSFTLGREQTNGIHINDFQLPHPEDNRPLVGYHWVALP